MKSYTLAYGHESVQFTLPDRVQSDWIEPNAVEAASDPLAVVREAILNPIDGDRLANYAGARSVAIAINDKTRPVPNEYLLPPLLDRLKQIGIRDEAICFYIATGTHAPMPAEEFDRILPENIRTHYRVVSHNIDDEENFIQLGQTQRHTPVFANRGFAESALKIVVGNIEPHHFAGYSGGYKTAAIGLVGRETINPNHAMLMLPESQIASFEDNPLRQDIEEIGRHIGVHFALNAILNGEKKIVRAIFGSPEAVMRVGIPLSRAICGTSAGGENYDLVIASVGGAPKDINFYQSQKALTHAARYVRQGGVILLVAECAEGAGNARYEQLMEQVSSFEEVFEKFRQMGFVVGPHKAFQVARIAQKANIVLLSAIPAGRVEKLLMTPAADMEDALAHAWRMLGDAAQTGRVAILPRATNTIKI